MRPSISRSHWRACSIDSWGGVSLPTAVKLRTVASRRGSKAVLVNGAEGEPLSAKDRVLLRSAPHDTVMQEVSLVISQGGHGTVNRALVNGVPLLILPMGRDQGDNAARVASKGAGLRLPPAARG